MHTSLPILYSFRRCPYAMRARVAIFASMQTCQLREVVLRDKPQTMLDISPKATVPVLQLGNGIVIEESLEIMQWALTQADSLNWLSAPTEETHALIQQNDTEFKTHLDRYKYTTRYEGADRLQERGKAEEFLKVLEDRLSEGAYLFGCKPTLADYAIFPFIRQFAFTDKDWFDQAPYPAVRIWLEMLLTSGIFQGVMKKYPQWHDGDEVTLFPPKD